MQEMRDETMAEEAAIAQERAHTEARLESVAVLKRPIRELLPLPPAVALGQRATVREALELMREQQLSCVLVVEQGQLVGVFTQQDVVAHVAGTALDVDQVPLREVMSP
jgi:CBS domain-containing protein